MISQRIEEERERGKRKTNSIRNRKPRRDEKRNWKGKGRVKRRGGRRMIRNEREKGKRKRKEEGKQ